MENVTTSLYELLNYTSTQWPLDSNEINNSQDERETTLSSIITPLAMAVKHYHSAHPEKVAAVTLSTEWTRLTRLIFLTILSVIGSVGNIFMISSVMIEDHLKKAGNFADIH